MILHTDTNLIIFSVIYQISSQIISDVIITSLILKMASIDVAEQQLIDYAKKNNSSGGVLTTSSGAPIGDKTQSKTANVGGPQLMQDFAYMDEMAHFNRERIPERVVHAKGAGAFGYFQVTHNVTKYTKAAVFSEIGKKTPVAVRFSTVGGESGSADTVRDPRGFAIKMFTSEGNWDLVGNNTPIFFVNDPIMFPSFIHTQKRNPETHLKDANMMWDFWSLRTESCHQVMFLFSDRGIPDGYRHMNGYGSHTFKLVNKEGNTVWCKFHFKTDQGSKNLPVDKAERLAGSDPDYSIRDLYNAIANGNSPSWTLYIQVMTNEEVGKCEFDPFDVTKVWPHKTYPLIEVGKMVLNRNPSNYFAEVEQMAFSPAHFVPGIEASPDKMLQGRLFAYSDAHRYRLGVNYHQVPVNKPHVPVRNYQKDGNHCLESSGQPVYYPNSFHGPTSDPKFEESKVEIPNGKRNIFPKNDDFTQAGQFYRVTLKAEERQRLAENIAGSLKAAMPAIQTRALNNFARVDSDLAKKITAHMKKA